MQTSSTYSKTLFMLTLLTMGCSGMNSATENLGDYTTTNSDHCKNSDCTTPAGKAVNSPYDSIDAF